LGANAVGDMFLGDQQGHWVPATPIFHLRKGKFFGNAETLKTLDAPGSPVHLTSPVTKDIPYPEAVKLNPELTPPAVWLPYAEICQSATDHRVRHDGNRFGPFGGQLFVADFTTASLSRVFLEKVNGEYQGACFPFRQGFACGIVRMVFGRDGSLFCGNDQSRLELARLRFVRPAAACLDGQNSVRNQPDQGEAGRVSARVHETAGPGHCK